MKYIVVNTIINKTLKNLSWNRTFEVCEALRAVSMQQVTSWEERNNQYFKKLNLPHWHKICRRILYTFSLYLKILYTTEYISLPFIQTLHFLFGQLTSHAVLIVGYGETEEGAKYWTLQNSWGQNWGDGGYFYLKRGEDTAGVESSAVTIVAY